MQRVSAGLCTNVTYLTKVALAPFSGWIEFTELVLLAQAAESQAFPYRGCGFKSLPSHTGVGLQVKGSSTMSSTVNYTN